MKFGKTESFFGFIDKLNKSELERLLEFDLKFKMQKINELVNIENSWEKDNIVNVLVNLDRREKMIKTKLSQFN